MYWIIQSWPAVMSLSTRELSTHTYIYNHNVDGLVQERRNSSALALELRLSCTNPSMWRQSWHHDNCRFPMSSDDKTGTFSGSLSYFFVIHIIYLQSCCPLYDIWVWSIFFQWWFFFIYFICLYTHTSSLLHFYTALHSLKACSCGDTSLWCSVRIVAESC